MKYRDNSQPARIPVGYYRGISLAPLAFVCKQTCATYLSNFEENIFSCKNEPIPGKYLPKNDVIYPLKPRSTKNPP